MKKFIFIFTILFLYQFSYADEIKISISSPQKVGVGQQFEIKYTIQNKRGTNPQVNNYSNFNLRGGPATGSSTNFSNINGNITQSTSYSYSYYFDAKTTGKFNLPTFSINIDGKTYSSEPTNIEVQKDPVQTSRGSRRSMFNDPWEELDNLFGGGNSNTQQAQPSEVTSEDLFVRIFINKTDLHKGEPIVATIKIFSAVDLHGFNDIKYPQFNSFFAEVIESPQRISFQRETYNNKTYNTAVLAKYILYPRVSGEIIIEPCELDCAIRQLSGRGWNSFYNSISKKIYSPEIKINVRNLPANSPSSFNGAVGNFNFKIDKSADSVNVNDALSIKLTLSGTGNFNMIEPPKITWPDEFEVYDPIIANNTTISTSGISGSKTWEYTVVPRYAGDYKLGKINFSYFDFNSNQYKTQTIDNINIKIGKGNNNIKQGDYNYSQRNVEYIKNDDIRFIKNSSLNLKVNYLPLIVAYYFPLFYIIPFIIFIILIIILRRKIKENSDLTKLKAKKANKISQKRLKKAKKYMQQNNKSEFYKEIISALWGYVGDKLSIPVSELTKQKVTIELENKKSGEETIKQLISIIDKCEYAHFAPVSAETELSYIYKEAVDIIEVLEQKIK